MTPNPRTVTECCTVNVAARRMRENRIRALPVIQDGRLEGIITAHDLSLRVVAHGLPPWSTYVRHVMTPEPFTCAPRATLEDAIREMLERHVQRLVVVDDAGQVVGMLDANDLVLADATRPQALQVLGKRAMSRGEQYGADAVTT